ncbi:MAG: serine/threonine-protein kinase [Myxococcales bacterium]
MVSEPPRPFGDYLLLDLISRGGMAEVWRARRRDAPGGALVAVKRLLPALATSPELLSMFLAEGRMMTRLAHPNIARALDVGQADGHWYIALEYVVGRDLRALSERAASRRVSLPVGLACYVVQKMCEGLDHAHHARGPDGVPLQLIHRDVSPDNCLVTFDGGVKLIDFGIAKTADADYQTSTGVLKGKFAYMSPEQVRAERVDCRSDVFSAGVVLYELLTGRRLFQGSNDFETLRSVLELPIPVPVRLGRRLPAGLEATVMRALDRERNRRQQRASGLALELGRACRHLDRPPTPELVGRWMQNLFGPELDRERQEEEASRVDRTLPWLSPEEPFAPGPAPVASATPTRVVPLPDSEATEVVSSEEILTRAVCERTTVASGHALPDRTTTVGRTRRRWPRWAVSVRVQGRWWDSSSRERPLAALLLSVSEGGARLRCGGAVMANSRLEFSLPLGRFKFIGVRGTVRWWSRIRRSPGGWPGVRRHASGDRPTPRAARSCGLTASRRAPANRRRAVGRVQRQLASSLGR